MCKLPFYHKLTSHTALLQGDLKFPGKLVHESEHRLTRKEKLECFSASGGIISKSLAGDVR